MTPAGRWVSLCVVSSPTETRIVAGRYRLLEPLGHGGMGRVWLADDAVLLRQVAVKEVALPPEGARRERERAQERVLREARAAAQLDHPGVVRVYDVVEEDGHPWIIMEVLSGPTLAELIREKGPLPVPRVAELGLRLVDALDHAHTKGILHRDVKPANVKVCGGDRVVLTDFGIATTLEDPSATRTGEIIGSPAYMSPERARGAELGPAADLFSLGATMYAAVEGRPPFNRPDALTTLTAVVHEDPAPPTRAGALTPVLEGLLAKDPAQRWDVARTRQALRALRGSAGPGTDALHTQELPRLVDQAPGEAPATTVLHAAEEPLAARSRRGPRLLLAAAAALVLVGAGVGGYFVATNKPDQHHTATSQPSVDGPFSPGQGPIPSTWNVRNGDGWSLSTPPGWQSWQDGPFIRFRRPAPYGTIGVATVSGSDPMTLLRGYAASWGDHHAAYQNLGVKRVEFRGRPGAQWDFSYTDSGAALRASYVAFGAGGTTYIVWWQTKPGTWHRDQVLGHDLLVTVQPQPS